jgi:hypothetical protein
MEETVGPLSTCGKTTLRVMAADKPYGEFYNFYTISPEYFGYYHVYGILHMTYMRKLSSTFGS